MQDLPKKIDNRSSIQSTLQRLKEMSQIKELELEEQKRLEEEEFRKR